MKGKTILLGLAVALAGAPLGAHQGATGVVLERMKAMEVISDAVKLLSEMSRGLRPVDQVAVVAAARDIASLGGSALVAQFPPESGGGVSEASPTIWSDPDGFANWAEQMTLRAESVAVAAETGQAFDGEFASLSETCRGCHEGYRVKK